jgi:hypothetical protein
VTSKPEAKLIANILSLIALLSFSIVSFALIRNNLISRGNAIRIPVRMDDESYSRKITVRRVFD